MLVSPGKPDDWPQAGMAQASATFALLRSEFGGVLNRGGDNGQKLVAKMAEIRALLALVEAAGQARKQAQMQAMAARSGADRDMKAARIALEKLRSRLADVAV